MRIERVAAPIRHGVAALALAVGVALLFKVQLLATFRAALIVLAAVEVLSFGQRALSARASPILWLEIVVKLAVLGGAYIAVGQ